MKTPTRVPRALSKLRIGAGELKGRVIRFHGWPGVRPTPARVRQAVFNMIRAYAGTHGFLDCCAGSGIMGFEAFSEGFRPVVWTDSHHGVCADLKRNIRELAIEGSAMIQDVRQWESFRLNSGPWAIFADPPYGDKVFHESLLAQIARIDWIAPGSLYIAEQEKAGIPALARGFEVMVHKRYGRVLIAIFKKNNRAQPTLEPGRSVRLGRVNR